MGDFRSTGIWRTTLADYGADDGDREAREHLRNAYLQFRERASQLAAEIVRDYPELTDHGGNHLDALWGLADVIAGGRFELTPAEAFAFGGAVLLHDLGLAVAAYPEGRSSLEESPAWDDAIAQVLRSQLGCAATSDEIARASEAIRGEAMKALLRQRHAEHAEKLGHVSWRDDATRSEIFLLDDKDLRSAFARVIGKVASSHGQSPAALPDLFPAILSAPPFLPREWTIDPVKVACLLRAADAAHLDTRRAPSLLRVARRISGESQLHWLAQGKLHQPIQVGSRLQYTSGEPFARDEADAWWLCIDLLKIADRELREVDALLEDSERQRFAVSGVRGIDSTDRMASFIETDGWLPIDAVVHVSDVGRLVEQLGGEQLYGSESVAAVRELIQNSIDAIRVRRALEGRPDGWGSIEVRVGEDEEGHWLEVRDNGVGMSPSVLSRTLIDFGQSLWSSSDLSREIAGLAGGGFQPIGKFGIGFFSIFMLGQQVKVTSRRCERGRDETYVLEFSAGVGQRPLLRLAGSNEALADGGTAVRVRLRESPVAPGGILSRWGEEPPFSVGDLCRYVAPASSVDIYAAAHDDELEQIIEANDWIELDPELLLLRLGVLQVEPNLKQLKKVAAQLRSLKLESGDIVGRACLSGEASFSEVNDGAITVGGLRANGLSGPLHGILVGDVLDVARTSAVPVVPPPVLADWATEQGDLLLEEVSEKLNVVEVTDVVRRCGGRCPKLPICFGGGGALSHEQVVEWLRERDAFFVINSYEHRQHGSTEPVALRDDVLVVESGSMGIVMGPHFHSGRWPEGLFPEPEAHRHEMYLNWKVVAACCEAWSCEAKDIEVREDPGEYGSFRGGPMRGASRRLVKRPGDDAGM
jgi:hypothetical protein